MSTFCIAMDNYFTLPGVIKSLRDKSIGVVGTARFKKNWPPKELKVIEKSQAEFNDFFYTYDDFGTLVARWMDNGLVFLVSTNTVSVVLSKERGGGLEKHKIIVIMFEKFGEPPVLQKSTYLYWLITTTIGWAV